MAERADRQLPGWAEQERRGDLEWINENLHVFWPAAQVGYQSIGRGAIVVDTTSRPTGEGHPFGYLDQPALEQIGDEDTRRLVREYEPSWEFVTTLFKSHDRMSSYRLGVLKARETLENRVEANLAEGTPNKAELEPPDLEMLMTWEAEGECEAACPHHCIVEPDGHCEHGQPSWLLKMGLI